jgi:hypothetical protein
MSTFDERETAFEAKFAHDEEMQFKTNARRNKYLGLWAAELKGEPIEVAQAYAQSVVKIDLAEAGHEDVVHLVVGYLGDLADEDTIRAKMAELMITAKSEIMDEHS